MKPSDSVTTTVVSKHYKDNIYLVKQRIRIGSNRNITT